MTSSRWWVEHGDAAEALKALPDGNTDALVTDPPAGIGFMGKEWDGSKGGRDKWIAWLADILAECCRVMKPGAYGWVWALPRTAHWTATACEDAGFAVRDVLVHVFGTGFPKSRSLLKPAAEHWILIKAPGELRELRIEENRIGTTKQVPASAPQAANAIYGARPISALDENTSGYDPNSGRWPANFALTHSDDCGDLCADGCPVKELDRQSGVRESRESGYDFKPSRNDNPSRVTTNIKSGIHFGDTGTASRFFYVAKPSSSERSAGLDDRNAHPTVKSIGLMRHLVRLIAKPGDLVLDPFTGSGTTGLAAIEEGCRFVGIEREPHFADIARQRLTHHSRQGRLF